MGSLLATFVLFAVALLGAGLAAAQAVQPLDARSASRVSNPPGDRVNLIGFRVARVL